MAQNKKQRQAVDWTQVTEVQSQCTAAEHIVFLCKNRAFFTQEGYWASGLPFQHLPDVLDTDLHPEFFDGLFNRGKHARIELFEALTAANFSLMERFFKLKRAFDTPEWLKVLHAWEPLDDQQKLFKEGVGIVRSMEKDLLHRRTSRMNYLLQFPLDQVLFGYLLWYQDFKVNPTVINNKAWQIQVEVAWVGELNRVLQTFATQKAATALPNYFSSQSKADREWRAYAALRISDKPRELILPLPLEYELIKQLANGIYNDFDNWANTERWAAGLAEFSFGPKREVIFRDTEAVSAFEYDNRKSVLEDYYFMSKSRFMEDLLESIAAGGTNGVSFGLRTSIANFRFWGIPEQVQIGGLTVSLEKVLTLLLDFSRFKSPEQRSQNGEKDWVVSNSPSEKFMAELGGNTSFAVYKADDLPSKVAKVFGWQLEDARSVLDFLTWDLEQAAPGHWLSRPFLKIKDQVYWLGALLMDRKWTYILELRMRSGELPPQFNNQLADSFENRVAETFGSAGFVANKGVRFKSNAGVTGDIDVLAFKDDCLFIIEAKNSLLEESFAAATFIEAVRFQGKAAYQLDKAKEFIIEASDEFFTQLGIPVDNRGNWRLYPMIVSRSFEGDFASYRSYTKVSLLELQVILHNELDQLYGQHQFYNYQAFQQIKSGNNQRINRKSSGGRPDYDLWKGKQSITPQDLIEAIETNAVWKEFLETWNFS